MSWIYPRRWWNAVFYDIWFRPAWFMNQFTKHFEEKQTCSARMSQPGPWEYKNSLDHWQTTRWCWLARVIDHLKYREGGTSWPWHWKPRTCSFCGGVHPEDAIKLVRDGWEVEGTTKAYKRYLQPPGYRQWCKELSTTIGIGPFPLPPHPPPVPPVKVYTYHFSEAQREQFNFEARRAA